MLKNLTKTAFAVALLAAGTMAHAGSSTTSWTLDSAASKVSFGSVKNDYIGEMHSFSSVNGYVSEEGAVTVAIDLASVETGIEKRNERLIAHVFKGMAFADLNTKIDLNALADLAVGDTTVLDLEGVLSLVGTELDLDVPMLVVRLSEDRVMAMTETPVFLDTEEAGIDAGVSKLMELASLDAITRSVPVTLRFVFNADTKVAATN